MARDTDPVPVLINAPDLPEQPNERRRRTDGSEKSEPILHAALHVVDRLVDRHGDPGIEIDVAKQSDVLAGRLEPRFGDVFFQAEDGIRGRNVTGVQTWLFR